MTEHLPECPPEVWCICSYLRDCEARVHEIAYAQGLGAGSDEHGQHETGWIKGYDAGLDAAEQVIRDALSGDGRNLYAELTALAAIDALRKDQP